MAGAWWRINRQGFEQTQHHTLTLADGDQLILHDDCPAAWTPDRPVTILIHGLGGCHASRYMVRIARKLNQMGNRAIRLDLRGCGAGRNLAKLPYHAGRWGDVAATVEFVRSLCPGSPLHIAGFSLGGNLLLRWLGEAPERQHWVTRAIAVSPPVDLAESTLNIARRANGAYDRHFARLLYRQVRHSSQWNPDSPLAREKIHPERLIDFDELFTAPLSGFRNAEEYYKVASAAPVVEKIRIPTLILSASDDPLIPHGMLTNLRLSPQVILHMEQHGGHLGFIAGKGGDPDRHWMDWRVLQWLAGDGLSPQSSLSSHTSE